MVSLVFRLEPHYYCVALSESMDLSDFWHGLGSVVVTQDYNGPPFI